MRLPLPRPINAAHNSFQTRHHDVLNYPLAEQAAAIGQLISMNALVKPLLADNAARECLKRERVLSHRRGLRRR